MSERIILALQITVFVVVYGVFSILVHDITHSDAIKNLIKKIRRK